MLICYALFFKQSNTHLLSPRLQDGVLRRFFDKVKPKNTDLPCSGLGKRLFRHAEYSGVEWSKGLTSEEAFLCQDPVLRNRWM